MIGTDRLGLVVDSLPLFPLQAVLFPGVLLPLRVFEERYRVLVRRLLERPEGEQRRFGVIAIREGHEVGPDAARSLHPVGCTAALRRVERRDDGTFEIVTVGVQRFRLQTVRADAEPYLVGDVEWLPERPEAGAELDLLAARVGTLFREYVAGIAATGGAEAASFELPSGPEALSYLVASAAALGLDDRQALLETERTLDRLRAEIRLLRREIVLLRELRAVPASLDQLVSDTGEN